VRLVAEEVAFINLTIRIVDTTLSLLLVVGEFTDVGIVGGNITALAMALVFEPLAYIMPLLVARGYLPEPVILPFDEVPLVEVRLPNLASKPIQP
jgi:hypothetical protein